MKIIAIDQSASATSTKNKIGWVILGDGGDRPTLVDHGQFMPDPPHFDAVRGLVKSLVERCGMEKVYVAVETVYYDKKKRNPAMFAGLVSVKEHIHATVRELGLPYFEVHPYSSMKTLTGITDRWIKSKERKAAVVAAACEATGLSLSEHESDAYAIGLHTFLNLVQE